VIVPTNKPNKVSFQQNGPSRSLNKTKGAFCRKEVPSAPCSNPRCEVSDRPVDSHEPDKPSTRTPHPSLLSSPRSKGKNRKLVSTKSGDRNRRKKVAPIASPARIPPRHRVSFPPLLLQPAINLAAAPSLFSLLRHSCGGLPSS
jgi:hypothetical protein